jgi:hypothetical protein
MTAVAMLDYERPGARKRTNGTAVVSAVCAALSITACAVTWAVLHAQVDTLLGPYLCLPVFALSSLIGLVAGVVSLTGRRRRNSWMSFFGIAGSLASIAFIAFQIYSDQGG